MDIGVMLPSGVPGVTGSTLRSWVRGIEDGPFSSVGVADRLAYANHDSMLTMAMAAALTDRDMDDAAQVGPLLDQVTGELAAFTADGEYDQGST